MYQIACDGLLLLDRSDNDLILVDPKVKLEVNTVGEGSFTIYKNHPHFNKLKKLKSVFEVTDDNGVIFRGRATRDTTSFDHGMFVDLEGAMAYFNDSIVRSFNYPDDFLEDANYIAAASGGNVVAFFLGWLINNHNSQVQDFQKMKLGNVTVRDPNNILSRSSSEYASTWEVLKSKLFDSALGGYLCIRYEADGNYIDYLAEFTETNSQEIAFGENMLDLKRDVEASVVYSAIIPIGVIGLTIEGITDRNVTDDIVKRGDTLYSKKAVEEYGWIYAPVSETTWEDVTDHANLLTKGAEWLAANGSFLRAMEAAAVDLHFADSQVESLRIYKNVNVYSEPHGISETLPLTKLEIDLLNPQNTKITVGKTLMPLTERTALLQEETKKKYIKLSQDDDAIKMEVQNLSQEIGHTLTLDENGLVVSNASGETVTINGGQVDATTIKAKDLQLSGVISWGNLKDDTDKQKINKKAAEDTKTMITDTLVASPTIRGGKIQGAKFHDLDEIGELRLIFDKETEFPSLIYEQVNGSRDKMFAIIPMQVSGNNISLWLGNQVVLSTMGGEVVAYGTWDFTDPFVLRRNVHYGDSYPDNPVEGQLFFVKA